MRKVTHSFEVQWNESACRKKVRLGLEKSLLQWTMAVTCRLFRYFVKNVNANLIYIENRSVGLLIQYKYHTSVYQIMSSIKDQNFMQDCLMSLRRVHLKLPQEIERFVQEKNKQCLYLYLLWYNKSAYVFFCWHINVFTLVIILWSSFKEDMLSPINSKYKIKFATDMAMNYVKDKGQSRCKLSY